jgi:beta-lactamase class A
MLEKKELHWNENLKLSKDIIGSGSGWMAYQDIGEIFPVFEVATEMIRVSDNTATNLLIKRLGGINIVNQKFKEIGLENTQINNYLPDLDGTNMTSTKDLSLAMALVDNGYLLDVNSRDIFREIMSKSKTNTLIPAGILKGLGKESIDTDYHLSLKGYLVHNKTGDIGISYSDTALIQTPHNSRVFASFIVQGPFNDPRAPELIRNLSAELVPFLSPDQKTSNLN